MPTQTVSVRRIPSISIFVRHSDTCPNAGDETYRRCKCPKHLRWSHSGRQHRMSARTRSWSKAEEVRRDIEAKFAESSSAPVRVETETRKTLQQAIDLFIQQKRNEGIGEDVVGKYERELERLKTFMERRSRFFPAEIRGEDLIEYQTTWNTLYPSSNTRSRVLTRMRAFLRFCHDSRWIDRMPKTTKVRVDEVPTLPLTTEQYEKLLDTIPKSFPDLVTIRASGKVKAHTRSSATKDRTGRMRALVRLMRHSGLSIHDAVTLPREEMIHDAQKKLWRVVTARQKTGTDVSVPLPPDVAQEVLAVFSANSNPRYAFWTGKGEERTAVSHWQDDFRKLFKDAGLYHKAAGKMVSHRLRDTFAVDLLEKGVPLEEVSKLLGHQSLKTTEKHYAKWVKGRQDRLDSLVTATWRESPATAR